ncbi:hypothetical protein, partial [Trichothermofontia sp.]
MLGKPFVSVRLGPLFSGTILLVAVAPGLAWGNHPPVRSRPDRASAALALAANDVVVPAVSGPAISVPTQVTPSPAIAPPPPMAPVM